MDARDMRLAWLQERPGLGARGLSRILDAYGGEPPASFYGQPAAWHQDRFGLSERAAAPLACASPCAPPWTRNVGALPLRAWTRFDAGYPFRLRRLDDPPPLIWALGSIESELTYGNLSVICSAKQDASDPETLKSAIEAGLDAGYSLVAGHNRPVYALALLAAKRRGASAVMVLDRGLLAAFGEDLARDPVAPARIWGYSFDLTRSVALSPFRMADPWIGANARLRDALVVALSDVIVALRVRPGGTMHRLCRKALARGRRVYADTETLPLLEDLGALPWTGDLPAPQPPAPQPPPSDGPPHAQNG